VVAGDFAWQEEGLVADTDPRPWIASTARSGPATQNVHRNPLA
jgi:hypothetical protein